jgi:hypothetical protein
VQVTQIQPVKYNFPEVDRAGALLFLASVDELRKEKFVTVDEMVNLFWGTIFVMAEIPAGTQPDPRDIVLRRRDKSFWRVIAGKQKFSDPTIRWLAQVHPRDLLYTLICSVDQGTQNKITEGWKSDPNEKQNIAAGLRKFQDQLKNALQHLISIGALKFPPTLLRSAG